MDNKRISCVIYKCTPSLIRKLLDMGYERINSDAYDIIVTFTSGRFSTYSHNQKQMFTSEAGTIVCGRNDELFLALAAITDRTDLHQWFIHPNGDWQICKCDSFKDEWGDEYDIVKATKEQIVMKFTSKLDNPTDKLERINSLCRMLPEQPLCKVAGYDVPRKLTSIHYDGYNTLFVFGMENMLPVEVYISEIEKIYG